MQCSWKSVVLLALASIAIQYTAIRTFSTKPFNLLCSVGSNPPTELAPTGHPVNCSLKDVTWLGRETFESSDRGCDEILSHNSPFSFPSYNANKRTHILILATTRSGSSFVGQLFNQNPEVRISYGFIWPGFFLSNYHQKSKSTITHLNKHEKLNTNY